MVKANAYIFNINKFLKEAKSNISVNFIWPDNNNILLTTNKVAVASDLSIIEKYFKESNNIEWKEDMSSRLL